MKEGDEVQRRIRQIVGEDTSDFRPTTQEERNAAAEKIAAIMADAQASRDASARLVADAFEKEHERLMKKEADLLVEIQEKARTFDPEHFDRNYGADNPGSAELTSTLAEYLRAQGVDVRHVYTPATLVVHGGEQRVAHTTKSLMADDMGQAVARVQEILLGQGHEVVFLLGMFEMTAINPETFQLEKKYKVRFFTTISLDEKPVDTLRGHLPGLF